MTFVIDIDNTIFKSKERQENCRECVANSCKFHNCHYYEVEKDQSIIDDINAEYQAGNMITIWTARGWDQYDITVSQLKEAGVNYHHLVMGNPIGTYIDADSYRSIKEYKQETEFLI